ncbi:hypothetical protein TWF718_003768 [Orbilia javanica]|uniref:Uncharacterized protein n=1 Tax=Orbilia javanica TaxID=47235 RepID=A0AAN8MWX8_9PEZI
MKSSWLARTALVLQATSYIHQVDALVIDVGVSLLNSPFYKNSLEMLSDTKTVQRSLNILKAAIWLGDPKDDPFNDPSEDPANEPTNDQFVCVNHPALMPEAGLVKQNLKDLDENWAEKAACAPRELALYKILESLTTVSYNVVAFAQLQNKTTREESVCKTNNFVNIFAYFEVYARGGREMECTTEERARQDFVSWSDYSNKYIPAVDAAATDMYNKIDAWVCRHKMTDKGLAYYGLFLRKPGESVVADTTKMTEAFSEVALKKVTSNIGTKAEALIKKLTQRAAVTKSMMQIYGKATKTQQDEDEIKKFCKASAGSIPGSQNAGTKREVKVSAPFLRYGRTKV